MAGDKINIGILGAADVAERSIIGPSKKVEGMTIYAIASRSEEKAKSFADKYNIPQYFKDYKSLLECKDIDAVYIPLINSLHAEWTVKAIKAGKHVLVEKPICLSSVEAAMIEDCIKNNPGTIVLEGLMSQHHPFNSKIVEMIKEKTYGNIGTIKSIASYKLNVENDFRLFPEKGGSVFFEEGLLWCHITQLCLGLNPINYESNCRFNGPNGGDHTFETKLFYPKDVSSELFCSYAHPYQADHFIKFENAEVTIKNYWRPTFGFQKLKMEIKNNKSVETENYVFEPQNYFYNQLCFFLNVIIGKEKNISLNDSFDRIRIMEKIFIKSKEEKTLV
jgi:dTDP-3,4-didehydro-2,6-dideoxy-alpha-D-glucose 3-reductase